MTQLLTPDVATDPLARTDAEPAQAAQPAEPAQPAQPGPAVLAPLPSPGRIPASARPSEARAAAAARLFRVARSAEDPGVARIRASARPSEARAAAAARLFRAARSAEDPGPARISASSRPSEARAAAAARLVGAAGSVRSSETGGMTEAARAVRTAQLIHSGLIRSGQPASAPNRLAADSAVAAGRPNGAGAARGVGDRGAPGGAAAAVAAAVAPAEPEQEKERHLRVVEAPVRTPAQRRRRARILLASAAGLAAIVAFGLVYLHVVLAQRQFALDRINAQVQTAQANYQQLRLKVAELGSPQHIITNAEGPLGMHQPTAVTYVTPTTRVAGSGATASTSTGPPPTVTQAPAGDADWPSIKSQLAGSP